MKIRRRTFTAGTSLSRRVPSHIGVEARFWVRKRGACAGLAALVLAGSLVAGCAKTDDDAGKTGKQGTPTTQGSTAGKTK